jgi:GNAT superfamily N-acetyltransferase
MLKRIIEACEDDLSMSETRLHLRPATPDDVPTILGFIRELAEYERDLDGWGEPARFTALIAEYDGVAAGFALYFTTYSTWRGHYGIWLEDLYVTPALRCHGIGKALLARLACIAVDEGCPRVEWSVLNWNEPAIAVYRRIGAMRLTEWSIMRLTGEPLQALAAHDGQARESR